MKYSLLLCLVLSLCANSLSADSIAGQKKGPEVPGLDYYLPVDSAQYASDAPRPDDILGWPFGAWHLRQHELVGYLKALSQWSDRLLLVEYGRTHGRRPLVALVITAPENHAQLEAIRGGHLAGLQAAYERGLRKQGGSADGGSAKGAQGGPVISYFAYGVHGDEHSGISAALLFAYHLAAARSEGVTEFLKDNIVIIDPSLNPDGADVFAEWVNRHRGLRPSAYRADREHWLWPEGRANYYWADLNRDWLPAVQPESQARMKFLGQWMPHLVSDYHDMRNTNRSYFFQPGIPEMVNPLHPQGNQELTRRIAAYHGKALDSLGSLYYTQENFEDFYVGKGSTYPDLCGSIGILLEQASSRGFHQDTEHGRLTFPFTIRNQLATSLSALEAVSAIGGELKAYQLGFYEQTPSRVQAQKVQAHLVSAPGDPHRLQAFRDLLDLHHIRYGRLKSAVEADGKTFAREDTLVIPTAQPRYLLLTSMLERRTRFASGAFYDVSAWHYPSAYGLHHAQLTEPLPQVEDWKDDEASTALAEGRLVGVENPVAYLFSWQDSHAPAVLSELLEKGIRCWAAGKPFATSAADGPVGWPRGTIVIPRGFQDGYDSSALRQLMAGLAKKHQIEIHGIGSGLSSGGIDLGSPSMIALREPRALLVVGAGVSATTAGDVWHQFDRVWQAPLTMVEAVQVSDQLLGDFRTLILADAPFERLASSAQKAIEDWVKNGGCLIAIGSSAATVAREPWVNVDMRAAQTPQAASADDEAGRAIHPRAQPYDKGKDRLANNRVTGIVVSAWFDETHPLAWGYHESHDYIALLKANSVFFKPTDDSATDPLRYSEAPLISGHISSENLQALKGAAAVKVVGYGKGRVILFADNPVFRGHWYGSSRLLANAVFFGSHTEVGH